MNREFTAEKPNEKWVTDVTEFKYGSSRKAYLSAILDLYDGSIISYVLGHSNNNQLVFETLDEAIGQLNGEHPLIHSDRGFQYTSHGFKRRLDQAGMTHSMSRVGKCIDNGPMESFWGTLKCEKYYLHRYETFEDLTKAIDEYIYFYNHERYQEKLNGLSPVEYRLKPLRYFYYFHCLLDRGQFISRAALISSFYIIRQIVDVACPLYSGYCSVSSCHTCSRTCLN